MKIPAVSTKQGVFCLMIVAGMLLARKPCFGFISPSSKKGGITRSDGVCSHLTKCQATTNDEYTKFEGMENVLFIEVGFGNDQHGQNPTKAVVRACRNAIEFNSIPSIRRIVPGGYENMKLRIQIAVPVEPEEIDESQIKAVFPYGQILPIEYQKGGMLASSGVALEAMGDTNDQMIIAIACVTVGY
mmetsp:Transcript_5927/g.10367  ORF Transcript_5927/g.10367 Transcript_5927/m.10367 type:complete len:187 (+) Transcript_5927:61-621(+)